jgi:lysyl-tRNA synthetase class 2
MKDKKLSSILEPMNMSLATTIKVRAEMLAVCRAFFSKRGVLEVDCPALGPYAAISSYIDVISAQVTPTLIGYLHTSPEYAMKRMLSQGSGDIYFLGHVYRQSEIGRLHSPEFTMAEWYRIGFTFEQLIQETCDFFALFLGPLPIRKVSYREAFQTHLGINYTKITLEELQQLALPYAPDAKNWDRDTLMHFLLSHLIEPHFGRGEITIFLDFPPHEAALACVVEKNGELVAERFEAYYEGIELCNGYNELPDGQELRRRFHEENAVRTKSNRPAYALDEEFIAALGPTFPSCCGVAVGFDRLLLLKQKARALSEVTPFIYT